MGKEVTTRVENNASIGERKNMNLPGVKVNLPTVTDQDVDDIVNFGIRHGVDFIVSSLPIMMEVKLRSFVKLKTKRDWKITIIFLMKLTGLWSLAVILEWRFLLPRFSWRRNL